MYNAPRAATALHPGNGSARRRRSCSGPHGALTPATALRQGSCSRRCTAPSAGGCRSCSPATSLQTTSTSTPSVQCGRRPGRGDRWRCSGDAASCVSLFGKGSTAAIAGARTLARSLDTLSDLPTALARYEKQHRRFVARGQRAVPVVSHLLIPVTQTGIRLRHAALRVAGRRTAARATS